MHSITTLKNSSSNEGQSSSNYYFYSRLSNAKTLLLFKEAIVEILGTLGLNSFRFAPVGVENPRLLSNWSADLLEQYEQYTVYDLVSRHAENQTSPVYMSTIADYVRQSPLALESNEKYLELYKFLVERNHYDIYNIPYRTPIGINYLFSVSKLNMEQDEFRLLIENQRSILYLLGDIAANIAIARYASYFFGPKAFSQRMGVTPKQVEILNIVAKGNVTLQGAAERLHISLDTANKHIAAIKAALGAKTQGAAVYRGIVTGLIDIDAQEWE